MQIPPLSQTDNTNVPIKKQWYNGIQKYISVFGLLLTRLHNTYKYGHIPRTGRQTAIMAIIFE